MHFESLKENFIALIKSINEIRKNDSNINEAQTRIELIDTLFFDCLAWDKRHCKTEEHQRGEYTDYTFCNKSDQRLFILEAKRIGKNFSLPIGLKNKVYPISHFKTYTDIYSAIEQTIRYCQNRGTK